MKPHRLAEYFPLLEGDEFEQLKRDIAENGLLEPLVIYDGQILDGVNRYNACLELGVLPDTVDFNGSDPLKYVISKNIRRRHLDISQKSMIATEMLPEMEEKARKRHGVSGSKDPELPVDSQGFRRSRDEAASVFGISGESVKRAKRVKEQAPDKVKDIIYGVTTVGQVDTELREAKARERARTRASENNNKERQEKPREVKEYMDAMAEFEREIKTAINVAEYGKFSPEAARYTINRHNKIRNILLGFDDILERIE